MNTACLYAVKSDTQNPSVTDVYAVLDVNKGLIANNLYATSCDDGTDNMNDDNTITQNSNNTGTNNTGADNTHIDNTDNSHSTATTDTRVFSPDYVERGYADGYLVVDESGKGKVLHFISNGNGDWKDKVKQIQEKLQGNDIAYFVVPEINSVVLVSKTNYMALASAMNIAGMVTNLVTQQVNNVFNNSDTLVNQFVENISDKINRSVNVEIKLVATAKNKVYKVEKVTLGKGQFTTFKVPDELKCADYEVVVEPNFEDAGL